LFKKAREAEKALKGLNGKAFKGRNLRVSK
jgi:RNA recognition motif-containing protein